MTQTDIKMGCDLHSIVQVHRNNAWESIDLNFIDWRSYRIYAFLAGVRNNYAIEPIFEPRGVPFGISQELTEHFTNNEGFFHTFTWFSLKELCDFNYDQLMEDRRTMINGDGGCTAPIGQGHRQTHKKFLGPNYFKDLGGIVSVTEEMGVPKEDVRIIIYFDN